MNTRNHEDIAMTMRLPLLRDSFAKDMGSLEALCLENHIHTLIEGTMIEPSKRRCS